MYDTSLPIEITADSLDVLQNNQVAVFQGKVEAIQGKVHLKSDKMVVHYRSQEESGNQISNIQVDGHVFLTTPEETARGDRGNYDVDAGVLTLDGNTLLTRGQNAVKGDHLVYDLNTGKSRVSSAGVAVGGSENKGSGRVKAVFVPEKKEDKE